MFHFCFTDPFTCDFTEGDHGGSTDDEVTSMLFAYNKKYDYLSDTKNDTMDQVTKLHIFRDLSYVFINDF